MSITTTKAVIFRQFCPSGLPELGVHFTVDEVPVPPVENGQILVQTLFISVDPYLRGRMKDIKSYFPGMVIGQPGSSGIVVKVVESKSPLYTAGQIYSGLGYWQEYSVLPEAALQSFAGPLPEGPLPLSYYLGILGMPGATAYFGYLRLCQPKAGETLVVSGAAGAVGSLVCQIGKIKGCKVIGIAGSEDKIEYLKKIGCDAAINYKTTSNIEEAIRQLAPEGVDQYFDNVGGSIKDAVYANLNSFARVSACGAISQYNLESFQPGNTWEWLIITKQLTISGFIVTRWQKEWTTAFAEMAEWIKEGKLTTEEMITNGIDSVVSTFNSMMTGDNIGKAVIKL